MDQRLENPSYENHGFEKEASDGILNSAVGGERRRGRGAKSNSSGRFEPQAKVVFDDGWQSLEELPPFKTFVQEEKARKIITRNDSPDIGFDRSINPYRGCEHGCIYCFARPTHAYQGLSPGLDFESKLFVKPDAHELLAKELAAPGYECRMIAMGTNTDPYQPIERQWKVTRRILEVLREANHPVGIVTKSALVTRDLDILSDMASRGLAKVALSITTLDPMLARAMEPRASTPPKRLQAIRSLAQAGVPAAVMVAPIIPVLNDPEIERILDSAADAGATEAGYVMLRMPLEIKDLFREWLQGLRRYVRKAADGHRALCMVDWPPLRVGLPPAGSQQKTPSAGDVAVQGAVEKDRSARSVRGLTCRLLRHLLVLPERADHHTEQH
jgi:DNA repair photolyase